MCIRPFFPQMKISTARLEPEKKKVESFSPSDWLDGVVLSWGLGTDLHTHAHTKYRGAFRQTGTVEQHYLSGIIQDPLCDVGHKRAVSSHVP